MTDAKIIRYWAEQLANAADHLESGEPVEDIFSHLVPGDTHPTFTPAEYAERIISDATDALRIMLSRPKPPMDSE